MNLQGWIAALIVAGCALYAACALMPAALRRRLLRQPASTGGCACSGCGGVDRGPAPGSAAPAEAVVTLLRRPR